MTVSSRLLLCCALCSCAALFSACAPLTSLQPSTLGGGIEAANEALDQPTPEEISYLDIESEDHLDEELAALEQAGAWEATAPEEISQGPAAVIYDFPITINTQVQFYLDQFQGPQRRHFQRWLARSTQFQPFIEAELNKAGLPRDLVFLAMIESGFNPSAYSKAHAAGLWQFIRGTGRSYGLRINSWVDERRNPEKATRAAIQYLSFLYREFGDWHLAVAAYNAGEGKIGRGLKRYKSKDFWHLASRRYLALETKRYVPKLIAAIIIGRDPEKYGFNEVPYQSPATFDRIKVPAATDLEAVAVTAATDIKTLRRLNNELRRNQTPPGKKEYLLRIPEGTRQLVAENMHRLHPVITTAYTTHTVRRGDTLTKVCRQYKINKTILLKANKLRTASLRKGQRLRIPYRTTKYILLKEGETPASRFASAGKDGRMILHQLQKGDTLSKIGKRYDVPVAVIMQWNGIRDVRKIRAGEQIALYIASPEPVRLAAADPAGTSGVVILRAQKKQPATASPAAERQVWYQVRNGDSLWTIARKFQVSARQLRSWNNLPSNLIHPGVKLVIKKV
ncbi:LysM peptidoglycan-binding domain-containing protein [Desulfogranum mediterraneum]|uniref:LysM peptidoglycan-binding domain-containing protein n=1 Tax=Desulfogranum mediterraneum TaxID=160661 RepID=UPI000414B08D|nr:LysM peptidoglycan-binding domain-containing protein [Desulfogranum mediterraneum]